MNLPVIKQNLIARLSSRPAVNKPVIATSAIAVVAHKTLGNAV